MRQGATDELRVGFVITLPRASHHQGPLAAHQRLRGADEPHAALECFRIVGPTTWYIEVSEIQRDLDRFIELQRAIMATGCRDERRLQDSHRLALRADRPTRDGGIVSAYVRMVSSLA